MSDSAGNEHLFTNGSWVCTGTIRVSDPCYDKDVSESAFGISGTLPAVPGQWKGCAVIDDDSGRIGSLLAWAEGASLPDDDTRWEPAAFSAGVDSGQCGVFDEASYPAGPTGEFEDASSFYGKACAVTLGEPGFGLVDLGAGPIGVVSSSGYGDGVYEVKVRTVAEGRVNAVQVTFIGDEENEEDEIAESDEEGEPRGGGSGDSGPAC